MARPYDEFLDQSDPFAGSKPTVWNAGSQQPGGFGNGFGNGFVSGGRVTQGNPMAVGPSTPGYPSGPSFNNNQQQQAFAERAYWAPDSGYGQSMSLDPRVSSSVRTQFNGQTTYVNRQDLDGAGNIKPEALSRYAGGLGTGGGGNDFMGQTGDPFSTGNLLQVGMQDAKNTQMKADRQWAKRDQLNQEFAGQLQRNRDAMGAQLKDTQATIKDSEERFLKSITDYKDLTSEAMSSVAKGIRKNAKASMQEAGRYTSPDGSMRTSQEIEESTRMVRDQVDSEVQSNLTPLAMQFNDAITKMNQDFASFGVANSQIRAAQQFQAIQYDLQGRGYLSEYVAANPETNVNLLDTLLAVAGVAEGRAGPGFGGGVSIGGLPPKEQGQQQQGRRDDRGVPGMFEGVSKPKASANANQGVYDNRIGNYDPFKDPSRVGRGGMPASWDGKGSENRRNTVQAMLQAGMQTGWNMGKGNAGSPKATPKAQPYKPDNKYSPYY